MFHFHPFPPPFLFMAHVIGLTLLAFTALVVARKFRRSRCVAAGESNQRFGMPETGNRAFDEYRRATLKKLEAEAEEFRKYLDGLRRAADAAAFDAFLKSRRSGTNRES